MFGPPFDSNRSEPALASGAGSTADLRRIEPDAHGPGGWLLRGERRAVAGHDVWAVIRASLRADPSAACVACGGVTLSRAQVEAEVDRAAAALHGARVGLHLPRSVASVVLTLAVWKNGGVYVPIAPDCPPARVQAIANACALDLVVAERPLELEGYAPARAIGEPPVFVHETKTPGQRAAETGGMCYIAHTSGSTGMPKGVAVSHANLLNRIACMRDFLGVGPADRILYKTSAVFDVHVWEFTLPLAAGCLMVIYPQPAMFDLPEVGRIIAAQGVTIVGFVPALLRLLLDIPGFVAGNALRAVLCGGEAWGPSLARDFHARLPGRRLYNSYGPAETTIAVANWPVPDDPGLDAICLGRPLANLSYLIEEQCDPADGSRWVTGLLNVGGAQVALGYVDGRGCDRFFKRVIDGESMAFYATGDVVQLDCETGSVRFKGRQDNQVKVNGVRIAIEEVEEAVGAADGVEDCAAIVTARGQFSQLCVAYTTRGNLGVPPAEVRQACASRLPAALVPTRLRQLPHLPRAPTGKIDRTALMAEFG